MIITSCTQIPLIIAGPIVRHVSKHQLTFWLITDKVYPVNFELFADDEKTVIDQVELTQSQLQQVTIGEHAVINLISISFEQPLSLDTLYAYNFIFDNDESKSLVKLMPDILYPDCAYPSFAIKSDVKKMLHGSCRKPHHKSDDGLLQVDKLLKDSAKSAEKRPAMLMMSGDQIYADDVAGPMLTAIHQTIEVLGLFDEKWEGATINSSQELFASDYCYYQRNKLLPQSEVNKAAYDKIFSSSKKPIFTSDNANNHLVTLAEVFAMYILVWSPAIWKCINTKPSKIVAEQFLTTYEKQAGIVESFAQGLPEVRRSLAHIPVYMIFDDHDVTDDWNLTRGWEEAAYGHPFSKRIIGNTLIGYWLCQGWGNAPDKFDDLNEKVTTYFSNNTYQQQDELIDELLAWDQWHYTLATTPKIIVLDTRTQRWRSESNAGKPSGLMDWEALSELQQELINQPEVILVSAAPIYGVKMIETIQRIFTFLGFPLLVDAENWMAHAGTANVMLNIFRHVKTPPNFIILSGDVHYSFFYEITHRSLRNDSRIFQITSSGIKNQFPEKLLTWLERFNRYLYASYSPLNWFTKRRRMKIKVRKPNINSKKTVVNSSGIGLITLTNDEQVVNAEQLTATGERVVFLPLGAEKE